MGHGGGSDQGIYHSRMSPFPASIGHDLGEAARNGVVDREWVECPLHSGEGPQPLRSDLRARGEKHPDVEFGQGHHGDRRLVREGSEIPFLLLTNEDGGVE